MLTSYLKHCPTVPLFSGSAPFTLRVLTPPPTCHPDNDLHRSSHPIVLPHSSLGFSGLGFPGQKIFHTAGLHQPSCNLCLVDLNLLWYLISESIFRNSLIFTKLLSLQMWLKLSPNLTTGIVLHNNNIFWCYWKISEFIYDSTFLLKILHKNFLNICELFWDVKLENEPFGKTHQNQRHKTGTRFHRNCRFFYIIPVHNSKEETVLGYSKIKPFNIWMG